MLRDRRGALLLAAGLSAAAALQPSYRAALRPSVAAAAVRMLSSSEDLSKLTVVQLKDRLRAAGMKVSGRKAELIQRLNGGESAPTAAAPAPPPPAPEALFTQSSQGDFVFPPIVIEACKS